MTTKVSKLKNKFESNTPLFYTLDQLKELGFDNSDHKTGPVDFPSRFNIGQEVSVKFGDKVINRCCICGIHFYQSKVAYDVYIYDTQSGQVDGETWTLATNLDSVSIIDPSEGE